MYNYKLLVPQIQYESNLITFGFLQVTWRVAKFTWAPLSVHWVWIMMIC